MVFDRRKEGSKERKREWKKGSEDKNNEKGRNTETIQAK